MATVSISCHAVTTHPPFSTPAQREFADSLPEPERQQFLNLRQRDRNLALYFHRAALRSQSKTANLDDPTWAPGQLDPDEAVRHVHKMDKERPTAHVEETKERSEMIYEYTPEEKERAYMEADEAVRVVDLKRQEPKS